MDGPTRSQLLNGSGLFLLLAVYFNLRSDRPTEAVDWAVMGIAATVLLFALIRVLLGRRN